MKKLIIITLTICILGVNQIYASNNNLEKRIYEKVNIMSDEKLKDFHSVVKKYKGKLSKKENIVIEEILKQIYIISKEREIKKVQELKNIIKEVSEENVNSNILKISSSLGVAKVWNWISYSSAGSKGQIEKYSWDFGDWGKSNLANPDYSYKNSGKYKVTLEVTYVGWEKKKESIEIIIEGDVFYDSKTKSIDKLPIDFSDL